MTQSSGTENPLSLEEQYHDITRYFGHRDSHSPETRTKEIHQTKWRVTEMSKLHRMLLDVWDGGRTKVSRELIDFLRNSFNDSTYWFEFPTVTKAMQNAFNVYANPQISDTTRFEAVDLVKMVMESEIERGWRTIKNLESQGQNASTSAITDATRKSVEGATDDHLDWL